MEAIKNNFERYEEAAELLKAIAHPIRLCIVKGLSEKGPCNVTHMYDCLDIPQSTVSQHIAKLKSAGIIKGHRRGTEIDYELCSEKVALIAKLLISELS